MDAPPAPLAPLTSVAAVCLACVPKVLAISHVVATISDFADGSIAWEFRQVCELGSLRLLRRVCARNALPDAPSLDPHYKKWLFNRGVKAAAARGDLDMVKWLAGEYMPGTEVTHGVDAAASRGHLPVVEWLITQRGNVTFGAETIKSAAYAGSADVMELVWQHLPAAPDRQNKLDFHHFELVPLECVEWAIGKGYIYGGYTLSLAAVAGRLDILQLVAGRLDAEYKDLQAQDADELGAHEDKSSGAGGASKKFPMLFRTSLGSSSPELDCLKWVVDAGFPWLRIQYAPVAMERAARDGCLELVKLLSDGIKRCPAGAMDEAAENGHLDVVKWLHETKKSGATCAMNWAASNGHLATVQWLHGHRAEGCTTFAMDRAALFGRLEVVQWLHENRSKGCTTRAMDGAACHGHLDVVR